MDSQMIERMVAAMNLHRQEIVLLNFWGEDAQRDVLRAFSKAVVAAGAAPLETQHSLTAYAACFAPMQNAVYTERYFDYLSPVDTVIDIFMYPPRLSADNMPEQAVALYRDYMRMMFTRLMQVKRFIQVRMPTAENAEGAGLTAEQFARRIHRAYDIDYAALQAACREKARSFDGKQHATLTTKGCTLSLSLAGRGWHIDAGEGDFPCGEVYIAPVETETNGTVHFDQLILPEGAFDNVTLTVEKGMVVASSNPAFEAYLQTLPENGRVVCELGIGMNPGVDSLVGFPVLDEKMQGAFHIGLGMNAAFGGTIEAESHVDLVGAGRVTVE